jgi:hypothetical protein
MVDQAFDADLVLDQDAAVRAAQIADAVITIAEQISSDTNTPACGVFQEIIKAAVGSMHIHGHGDCADALLKAVLVISAMPADTTIN